MWELQVAEEPRSPRRSTRIKEKAAEVAAPQAVASKAATPSVKMEKASKARTATPRTRAQAGAGLMIRSQSEIIFARDLDEVDDGENAEEQEDGGAEGEGNFSCFFLVPFAVQRKRDWKGPQSPLL